MKKHTDIQFITKHGQREWAILPYAEYKRLRACEKHSQQLETISDYDVATFNQALQQGVEELVPEEYAKRLIAGENAIRVWREYRELTQIFLAKHAGISAAYLSQIENGERQASLRVLKKLATVLRVSLDDLS